MKQLTDAERQQLKAKIKDEKERQQALRERNPDLPETLEVASAKRGLSEGLGQGISGNTVSLRSFFACSSSMCFAFSSGKILVSTSTSTL